MEWVCVVVYWYPDANNTEIPGLLSGWTLYTYREWEECILFVCWNLLVRNNFQFAFNFEKHFCNLNQPKGKMSKSRILVEILVCIQSPPLTYIFCKKVVANESPKLDYLHPGAYIDEFGRVLTMTEWRGKEEAREYKQGERESGDRISRWIPEV